VLLVEDNDHTRTGVARYLRSHGKTVLEARDGRDALEVLERHPGNVDVIVTDLAMPRMDGIELVEHVRQHHPTIGVIAVTAFAATDRHRTLRELQVEILEKPMTPRALMAAVNRLQSELRRAGHDD
jgi:two-component system cell cycle sensor histidine kinase/response regulator CckA